MSEIVTYDLIRAEATRCALFFDQISFNDCIPLSNEYPEIPALPGIYVFKTSKQEILYVGAAARGLRNRFINGHVTLLQILIDGAYTKDEIRIACYVFDPKLTLYILDIEARVILLLYPVWNIKGKGGKGKARKKLGDNFKPRH